MNETSKQTDSEQMLKQRILMSDGKRYLIFYTFGGESKSPERIEPRALEPQPVTEMTEEKSV